MSAPRAWEFTPSSWGYRWGSGIGTRPPSPICALGGVLGLAAPKCQMVSEWVIRCQLLTICEVRVARKLGTLVSESRWFVQRLFIQKTSDVCLANELRSTSAPRLLRR